MLLHRRLLQDDHRGVDEALNETMCGCTGCKCAGLVARGTFQMLITPLAHAPAARRTAQALANDPILPFYLPDAYRARAVESARNNAVVAGALTRENQGQGAGATVHNLGPGGAELSDGAQHPLMRLLRDRMLSEKYVCPGFTGPGFTGPGFTGAESGKEARAREEACTREDSGRAGTTSEKSVGREGSSEKSVPGSLEKSVARVEALQRRLRWSALGGRAAIAGADPTASQSPGLPRDVALVTLMRWRAEWGPHSDAVRERTEQVLLRLGHVMQGEENEQARAHVDLCTFFPKWHVHAIEMTLSANARARGASRRTFATRDDSICMKDDAKECPLPPRPPPWSAAPALEETVSCRNGTLAIVLGPMQIRTFVIAVER